LTGDVVQPILSAPPFLDGGALVDPAKILRPKDSSGLQLVFGDTATKREDEDFTETSVLLGYASTNSSGEEISRLGGRPVCI
jgi:hypothetical protein